MSAATNLPERIFAFYIDKIFMNCITYPVSYLVFVLFLKTASYAFKRVELSIIWIFLHNLQKRTIEINKGAQISVRPRIKEKKTIQLNSTMLTAFQLNKRYTCSHLIPFKEGELSAMTFQWTRPIKNASAIVAKTMV